MITNGTGSGHETLYVVLQWILEYSEDGYMCICPKEPQTRD